MNLLIRTVVQVSNRYSLPLWGNERQAPCHWGTRSLNRCPNFHNTLYILDRFSNFFQKVFQNSTGLDPSSLIISGNR